MSFDDTGQKCDEEFDLQPDYKGELEYNTKYVHVFCAFHDAFNLSEITIIQCAKFLNDLIIFDVFSNLFQGGQVFKRGTFINILSRKLWE